MEPLHSLAIIKEPAACKEGDFCRESPSNSTHSKCNYCRLSPANKTGILAGVFPSEWHPINSKHKHPILEKEKRDANRRKVLERQQIRKNKDRDRKAVQQSAKKAEQLTQKAIIKATRNSGRTNRDGDHLFANDIVLDTKLQSRAESPVVHLHELDKVRTDAKRHNKIAGALVIRNKTGRGVVVFDLSDFALLFNPESSVVKKE
jgi:hypothetical protein